MVGQNPLKISQVDQRGVTNVLISGGASSDFELTTSFIPTDPLEYNIPCTGAQSQLCGSSWRLQVYDIGFLGDQGVDHPEDTEAPTEAPTTTSQPETTTSSTTTVPKTISPTGPAVLILVTASSHLILKICTGTGYIEMHGGSLVSNYFHCITIRILCYSGLSNKDT